MVKKDVLKYIPISIDIPYCDVQHYCIFDTDKVKFVTCSGNLLFTKYGEFIEEWAILTGEVSPPKLWFYMSLEDLFMYSSIACNYRILEAIKKTGVFNEKY